MWPPPIQWTPFPFLPYSLSEEDDRSKDAKKMDQMQKEWPWNTKLREKSDENFVQNKKMKCKVEI